MVSNASHRVPTIVSMGSEFLLFDGGDDVGDSSMGDVERSRTSGRTGLFLIWLSHPFFLLVRREVARFMLLFLDRC